MQILTVIRQKIENTFIDLQKPDSFRKGEMFEKYVRKEIFTQQQYALREKTHDYATNKRDFVQSSMRPDFKFYDKTKKQEFWLEAKYRSQSFNGKVQFCKEERLQLYMDLHKTTTVFVLFGVGGKPNQPGALYLLSMNHAKYTQLYDSLLKKFEIPLNKTITPGLLWNR